MPSNLWQHLFNVKPVQKKTKRQKGGKGEGGDGGCNAITVECAHKMKIKSIGVNYKFEVTVDTKK